jgi:hypothetical protein
MKNTFTRLFDRAMGSATFTAIYTFLNLVLLVKLAIEVGWHGQPEFVVLLLAQAFNTWLTTNKFLANVGL